MRLFIDAGQPWDDSQRFYNFSNDRYGHKETLLRIKQLIGIISDYAPDIVQREIGESLSQDDLNYLHHIFEIYHGLYDQQHCNQFFMNAPQEVQEALGDLNIWIHRYETLGSMARFVATWKYKPYRDNMLPEDFEHFSLYEQWGDLRLNYCEIGKTLYDMWHDNDHHMGADAFVPHSHYCFDFTVRFSELSDSDIQSIEKSIWQYYDVNQKYFQDRGFSKYDKRLSLGGITIGKLDISRGKQYIFDQISQHQTLKQIKIVDDQQILC